ncbi:hypothetical protein MM26B8_04550 [Mycoplasmopsis meleagridis]|nr:hypothetical protein MM26B8_04550 [Mycoplasmopsis meleagridis]
MLEVFLTSVVWQTIMLLGFRIAEDKKAVESKIQPLLVAQQATFSNLAFA